jgi:hypothetical protein
MTRSTCHLLSLLAAIGAVAAIAHAKFRAFEQIFGTNRQVPHAGRSDKDAEPPVEMGIDRAGSGTTRLLSLGDWRSSENYDKRNPPMRAGVRESTVHLS